MPEAFDLHERLLKALQTLGFEQPTPVQQAAIPLALAGRDLQVTAQTGSGKTAAFLLPMLQRFLQESRPRTATRALILLPTRELAQQTQKQLEQLAQFTFVKSALVTGGEDFKRQAAAMRKNPEILIGTPGRLLEHQRAGHLELQDVEVLVLDEADRMLDMGFSDDVLELVETCNPGRRQTLLFSATSGGKALARIAATVMREPQYLGVDRSHTLNPGTRQQIITADSVAHKEQLLVWLLSHETYDKAIVFTNTRDQADRLGGVLIAAGQQLARAELAEASDDSGTALARPFKSFVLHGDKDQKDRRQALARLQQGHIQVLVATDVAARGLDIAGMDLVVNFDMPRSGDIYVHRIGRTGRAGNDGCAISLIGDHEWNLMASIQRYLKQQFEHRVIKGLKAHYQGPKKLKSSGKAAGSKKKKTAKKTENSRNSPARRPSARPAAQTSSTSASGSTTTRQERAPGKPAAAASRDSVHHSNSTAHNSSPSNSANNNSPKNTSPRNGEPRKHTTRDSSARTSVSPATTKRRFGDDSAGASRDGASPLRRKHRPHTDKP